MKRLPEYSAALCLVCWYKPYSLERIFEQLDLATLRPDDICARVNAPETLIALIQLYDMWFRLVVVLYHFAVSRVSDIRRITCTLSKKVRFDDTFLLWGSSGKKSIHMDSHYDLSVKVVRLVVNIFLHYGHVQIFCRVPR